MVNHQAMDDVGIVLLRGINVGGRNKLLMQALRDLLTGLGLRDVKTYIQSGNAVFRWGEVAHNRDTLADQIRTAIGEAHGFTPNVHLITAADLHNAITNNPFESAADHPKTVHLYFLAGRPDQPDLAVLEQLKTRNERFALIDQTFYLYAPDGSYRSKLAPKIERTMGVSATARNWRTVNKLAELVATYT